VVRSQGPAVPRRDEGLEYDNLHLFDAALSARHGAPTSLEDYVKKAQLMNYEGERVEYEAYSRAKYHTRPGRSLDAEQRLAVAHLAPLRV